MAINRRTFLIGAAGALVLAACGDGDDGDGDAANADSSAGANTTAGAGGLAIARVFSPVQPGGAPLRLPIALADAEGAILDDVPATISVRYGPEGSADRSEPVVVRRHDDGIPTPYFPLVIDFPDLGTWQLDVEAGGERAATTVEVVAPNQTAVVPSAGGPLVALQTPTVDDPRGVDPICTRDPACPFHEETLEAAMATGKAIAFVISTPQFCQTAICGPVLDLLVDRHAAYADTIAFVHAEVYTDSTARTTTEAVQAYGLTWEPALFLALPDGTITSRLDYTFDGVELDEALSRLIQ